ncbi:hypothetical protein J2S55_008346 [Streptosporangium brasiliense]|uniref:Uncharacterized protein n=1 Tax=Streptosporangium brasiliense TaxID=47480 RepID=A0ABT9RL73_9ACTN|nr:hypothetical protein [Streptosporangium brasiliense]
MGEGGGTTVSDGGGGDAGGCGGRAVESQVLSRAAVTALGGAGYDRVYGSCRGTGVRGRLGVGMERP